VHALEVTALYAILFLSGEIAVRTFKVSPEVTRRYVHFLSGLLATFAGFWLSREEIIGLAILFIGVLFVSKRLSLLGSIHSVTRTSWGELFFPAGVGLAAFLYLPQAVHLYYLSVLIVAISDPLANLVGSKIRSFRLPFGKSLLGSIFFFVSSVATSLFFLPPAQALLVAALATTAEAFSPYGSDNLTVIPAVGLAVLLFPFGRYEF
jgi:phytol kinase